MNTEEIKVKGFNRGYSWTAAADIAIVMKPRARWKRALLLPKVFVGHYRAARKAGASILIATSLALMLCRLLVRK